MFVQLPGASTTSSSFAGSTLVIPCHSAGMSPFIGLDLYILNEGMQKIGYYKSDYIAPGVSNDGLSLSAEEGQLTLPAEIFVSSPLASNKLTFLVLRSGVLSGQMRKFGDELSNFIKTNNFASVVVLSSTMSPVQRERNTNRLIPEVFAYVSNAIYEQNPKYYEVYGIRKFGYWLNENLKQENLMGGKKKNHRELDELMGAGLAKGLLKTFNKKGIAASLFVIFTPGGIDFVGGYSYYQFLKNNLFQGATLAEASLVRQLGKLKLSEQSGEEIHAKLFERGELKAPAYWKQIVSYF